MAKQLDSLVSVEVTTIILFIYFLSFYVNISFCVPSTNNWQL